VRGPFGQKQAETEFDLETQTHLQLLTEKFIRQGMDRRDADSAARCQFGNTTLLRQRHRESRTLLFFPNLLLDLRYGLRMLWKSPSFTVIAALTLALGIGATSAVFSLIQGVLLTPPPYQKPQQLMLIQAARTDGKKMDSPRGWAAQQWLEWNERVKSFQGVAGYNWTFNFLIRDVGSQSMQGMEISKDYFHLLGLKMALGHGFEDSDFGQGHVKSIVLGYEFWQRAFGGDKNIRQGGAHQPLGFVTGCHWSDGTRCAISALARSRERTELRRQRDGGHVGAWQSGPEVYESSLLERGRPVARRGNSAAGFAGVVRNRHTRRKRRRGV
jgi:hypothetical protein